MEHQKVENKFLRQLLLKYNKVSFKRRIFYISLFLIVSIVSINLYYYIQFNQQLEVDAKHRIVMLEKDISSYIDRYISVNKSIAQSPIIQKWRLNSKDKDNSKVLIVLNSVKAAAKASIIYIMNEKGTVIACTPYGKKNKSLTGKNYVFRPYFSNAIKGKSSIYIALGVTTNKRGIYYSYPIYLKESKKPSGVIVIKKNIDEFEQLFQSKKSNFISGLLSKDGVVIASNKKEWLFKSIHPLADSQLKIIRASKQFSDKKITQLNYDFTNKKIKIEDSTFSFVELKMSHFKWNLFLLLKIDYLSYIMKAVLYTLVMLIAGILILFYLFYLEKKRLHILSEQKKNKIIHEQKLQQDGDYFLTSLIQKPLSPNNARSENVKVDFIIEQYKKFQFRKWKSDIGGDICITNNITLGSSSYVIFLNGDAMGKSLQGAGGALVLGAAFQAVLERSRAADVQRQSPERWLKNAFHEMHSIFESFDGSMLMSVVIGLVEEKTGLLYFINAEHPYTVLYRDGKAQFIEKDGIFRKLGSAIVRGGISVKTFQLKHKDIILIGSDGRDDIFFSEKEDGTRIINEDENLFLKIVEQANGDLNKIKKISEETGKLIDDYSLIRIEFLNPEKLKEPDSFLLNYLQQAKTERKNKNISKAIEILEDATKSQNSYHLVYKELFRNYLSEKNYEKAVHYGEKYCKCNPADTQSMYALSVALKLNKQYNRAIDFGERVRLREAEMIENLINLADSYFRIFKYEKSSKKTLDMSKKILNKAKTIDSDNEKVELLFKLINEFNQ